MDIEIEGLKSVTLFCLHEERVLKVLVEHVLGQKASQATHCALWVC